MSDRPYNPEDAQYEPVMPFLATKDNDGPLDSHAYVCGVELGDLMYGKRRHLICRLPVGHTGRHAIRRSLRQLLKGPPRG